MKHGHCVSLRLQIYRFLRYFLDISFHGANYHGWQIQPGAISVQEVMERTIGTLLRQEVKVVGAGRTDTGVHARQMILHFDSLVELDSTDFVHRLNSFLPADIAANELYPVQPEAHARFDASERAYQYLVCWHKDPFLQGLQYKLHDRPDIDKMNEAAAELLTHKNFKCFCRSGSDVKTYTCDVSRAVWTSSNNVMVFEIAADRFLRNMVRAVVGTLLDVGFGRTTMEQFRQILQSEDRSQAGASVPAHGLYLYRIIYPEEIR